ncbi:hypothetical protein B0T21DRAFT_410761 [Apiosordaria backusii]|uniref:Uncharacterized protein n=1 Tax=Apiosordaria backusii TaxID=314023 RepID=A0AA40BNB6_9PEZI|nr:hypothetical protein B0T21DRAFT_410761 [Apiosordaria backusii]
MRPTSLFLLGAAGLTSLVSGQTTTTTTETGTVSSYTSVTTVFPGTTTASPTATPATTSPLLFLSAFPRPSVSSASSPPYPIITTVFPTATASVVPTNGAGRHAAGVEGPLAGLVVFAVMAVGLV